MQLTKSYLKQIIKKELRTLLNEDVYDDIGMSKEEYESLLTPDRYPGQNTPEGQAEVDSQERLRKEKAAAAKAKAAAARKKQWKQYDCRLIQDRQQRRECGEYRRGNKLRRLPGAYGEQHTGWRSPSRNYPDEKVEAPQVAQPAAPEVAQAPSAPTYKPVKPVKPAAKPRIGPATVTPGKPPPKPVTPPPGEGPKPRPPRKTGPSTPPTKKPGTKPKRRPPRRVKPVRTRPTRRRTKRTR